VLTEDVRNPAETAFEQVTRPAASALLQGLTVGFIRVRRS